MDWFAIPISQKARGGSRIKITPKIRINVTCCRKINYPKTEALKEEENKLENGSIT
jgi:hypothetical protein